MANVIIAYLRRLSHFVINGISTRRKRWQFNKVFGLCVAFGAVFRLIGYNGF